MVGFGRFFALPNTPFDRLNPHFSSQIDVDPSILVSVQTWEFKSGDLAIFIDAQLELLIIRHCRNRMPMRQMNMLSKILGHFVGILDRVLDARWQMAFYALKPVFAHS